MKSTEEIIDGCRRGDDESRRLMYERFAAPMYGVLCRYVDRTTAEDLLHDGFITLFTKIGGYRGEGSFEGWCRRIFVNTALGWLRKKNPLTGAEETDILAAVRSPQESALERMSERELLDLMNGLPDGFRTVLNLYAVEGYSHKEIGEMLGVSENTSRSQYSRARSRLAEMIEQRENNIRQR